MTMETAALYEQYVPVTGLSEIIRSGYIDVACDDCVNWDSVFCRECIGERFRWLGKLT